MARSVRRTFPKRRHERFQGIENGIRDGVAWWFSPAKTSKKRGEVKLILNPFRVPEPARPARPRRSLKTSRSMFRFGIHVLLGFTADVQTSEQFTISFADSDLLGFFLLRFGYGDL